MLSVCSDMRNLIALASSIGRSDNVVPNELLPCLREIRSPQTQEGKHNDSWSIFVGYRVCCDRNGSLFDYAASNDGQENAHRDETQRENPSSDPRGQQRCSSCTCNIV